MKVLVLGGDTGFIGSHLSRKLKDPFECKFVSMRNLSWLDDNFTAESIINLVGKAHDFTRKALEEDFFYANFELAKKPFNYLSPRKLKFLSTLAHWPP
ncbi:hypothetical protein KUH03_17895 [Sphingobacterium sp. E70]|uniref:hypothetical protein n=1 Tax=Sphingobacterium sp. E70 TaxID=2853439 RepID=UPI00211C9778|nr:hypothetical protein [Sphingobacterium sp. E70]ULT28291.1 hypothetical protein KUH03_17895 [Sphingobacterium sp. E70]